MIYFFISFDLFIWGISWRFDKVTWYIIVFEGERFYIVYFALISFFLSSYFFLFNTFSMTLKLLFCFKCWFFIRKLMLWISLCYFWIIICYTNDSSLLHDPVSSMSTRLLNIPKEFVFIAILECLHSILSLIFSKVHFVILVKPFCNYIVFTSDKTITV